MARHIAEKLRERLNRNVVVENRAGASGAIAIDAMKSAPTDGSVLMYGTSATNVAQVVTRKNPTFDLEKDLTAIALTGTVCVVYAVSATLGVNNIAEYIAWLKKNPKNPTFGITGGRRASAAPDLPTVADLGYPKLTYEGFYGFYGPGKMSPALVNLWNRELRAATESPDLKDKLLGLGLEVLTSTPAEMHTRQMNLVTTFTASMKAAGYTPE